MLGLPIAESSIKAHGIPSTVTVVGDRRGIRSSLGSLTNNLLWRRAGERSSAKPLFGFEMVADRGDTYTPSLDPKTSGRGVLRRSRVALRGPLRAAIDSNWRVSVRGRRSRSAVDVETRAALDAGARFVRVHVSGVNTAQDHRLRMVFNTGVRPRKVLADAAFAFLERKALRVPAADQRAETPLPTAPLHQFVSVFDGARGCTVVSDGLAEYEVLANGAIAITLVRAVGQLSRADLPERPGHAGWPEATPGAQCLGPIGGDFAITWHAGDSSATRAEIVALVDDVLLPLTGETRRDLVALPSPVDGIALEGLGLAFSALKESDDGQHIVARCVNVTGTDVRGAWVLPGPVAVAHAGRLDETPLAPLEMIGTRIPILVPANAIHTVLIDSPAQAPDDSR
jgi:alpha-mannosidase